MNTQTKYRPYFSSAELQEIVRCVKATSTNISLLRYLESFVLKIQHDTISPQLTTKPAATLEQKLGLTEPTTTNSAQPITNLISAYNTNPGSLTPSELQRVHQYRYENDLMSSEEESLYEASLMFGESFNGK